MGAPEAKTATFFVDQAAGLPVRTAGRAAELWRPAGSARTPGEDLVEGGGEAAAGAQLVAHQVGRRAGGAHVRLSAPSDPARPGSGRVRTASRSARASRVEPPVGGPGNVVQQRAAPPGG